LRSVKNRQDVRFSYGSNNSWFFDEPKLIQSTADLHQSVIQPLMAVDINEHIKTLVNQKQGSEWQVDMVTDMTCSVAVLNLFPAIGAPVEMPNYILQNKSLHALTRDHNDALYDDYLCLFRCLALHRGHSLNNLAEPTKQFLFAWCAHKGILPNEFFGFELSQLQDVEDFFRVNIEVYEMSTFFELEMQRKNKYDFFSSDYLMVD